MNKVLLKEIILSDKSLSDIISHLNNNIDDFINKLSGDKPFDTAEMSLLAEFIPLCNPNKIFFDTNVPE